MEGNLKSLGWYLSEEGIGQCLKRRQVSRPEDVAAVALEMDLRSIGAASLPVIGGKKKQELVGPLVLQLQKVKNVALSPSKQNSQSNKRFLRLELTDGHKNISAVELQGPIEQLSLDTPPGTKIKIKGKVEMANGFLLLSRSCVDVLGGRVEGLLKKWHTTKVVPDNLGRENSNNEGGPPQFVKFGKSGTGGGVSSSSVSSVSSKQPGNLAQKTRQSSPARETSTREKMELPSSYFADGASKKKEDTTSSDSAKHAPSLVKHHDNLASGMRDLSLSDSHVVDIEALVTSDSSGNKPNSRFQKISSVKTNLSTGSRPWDSSGPIAQRPYGDEDSERGVRGRGRGRGRGRQRENDGDDYRQEKRKDVVLSDFFAQRDQQGQQHSVPQEHVDTLPDDWPDLQTEHGNTRLGDGGELRGRGQADRLAEVPNWKKGSTGNEGRGRGRGRGVSRDREVENTPKEKNWNFSESSSESKSKYVVSSNYDGDESNHGRRGRDSDGRRRDQQSEPSHNYSAKFDRRVETHSRKDTSLSSKMAYDDADYKGRSADYVREGNDRLRPYPSIDQQGKSHGISQRGYANEERGTFDSNSRNRGGRREGNNGRSRHSRGRGQQGDKHRGYGGAGNPSSYGNYEDRKNADHGFEARNYESHPAQHAVTGSSPHDTSGSFHHNASGSSRYNTTSSSRQHTSDPSKRKTTGSLQHGIPKSSRHDTSGSMRRDAPGLLKHDASDSSRNSVAGSSKYDKAPSQQDSDDYSKHNNQSSHPSGFPGQIATLGTDTDEGSHWDFLYQSSSARPATAIKGRLDF